MLCTLPMGSDCNNHIKNLSPPEIDVNKYVLVLYEARFGRISIVFEASLEYWPTYNLVPRPNYPDVARSASQRKYPNAGLYK